MKCPTINTPFKAKRTAIYFIGALFAVFCMIYFFMLYTLHREFVYELDFGREGLDKWYESNNVDFKHLTEEQYELLLKQTGLGKAALDSIVKKEMTEVSSKGSKQLDNTKCKAIIKRLEEFQEKNFNSPKYTCEKTSSFSSNERFRDKEGDSIVHYELVDVKQGDVLVSTSTHTLGYRHGHCGIVVSEDKTLEAVYWGKPTKLCNIKKWESCPTLLQLRVSEKIAETMNVSAEELGKKLAGIAINEGVGVRYSMFPDIFNYNCDTMKRTQCAHLVWYTFYKCGLDIDSDGGIIVTPWDIAQSDVFEIVQVYGINIDSINRKK